MSRDWSSHLSALPTSSKFPILHSLPHTPVPASSFSQHIALPGSITILKVKSRLLGTCGSSLLSSSLPKLSSHMRDWSPSQLSFNTQVCVHTDTHTRVLACTITRTHTGRDSHIHTQAGTHTYTHRQGLTHTHTGRDSHIHTRVMTRPGFLHHPCSFHHPGPRDPRVLCNSYPHICFAPPSLSIVTEQCLWSPNSHVETLSPYMAIFGDKIFAK